ncbi:GAF and ANTAR domain-containing protein [Nakamurella flava]|uniref:GAF and ANTAR domain-containing protein n=1 Tax=Nakamurella flava TaxID=2576308 RepID=A0A4U6QBB0_9ACTN|nr:GAF and ANTAR domain-containing protein [Nakamurella flava]TKV57337.1 GAF and ANTAR domain-containing protein [Nakamurella flava]
MDDCVSGVMAEGFRTLGDRLFHTHDVAQALTDVARLAQWSIPRCDWAGLTQNTGRQCDRFTTIAATDPVVRVADDLQYHLAQGPAVAAMRADGLFRADDLRQSNEWPEFGARVTADTPIRSALSLTVHVPTHRAALNLYSASVGAFTTDSVDVATMFAAHAEVMLMLVRQTDKVVNLDRALTTSRLVGHAVGILMYAYRIDADAAFDRLRVVSSNMNRKLTDVAAELVETGLLPTWRPARPSSPPRGLDPPATVATTGRHTGERA